MATDRDEPGRQPLQAPFGRPVTGSTFRRRRSELLGIGGYLAFIATAAIFAVAWLLSSVTRLSSALIGWLAVAATFVAIAALLVASARSRVDIHAADVAIRNPLLRRRVPRAEIQAVTLKRVTGQVASAQLRLRSGGTATAVAVGPRELAAFRAALALDV